MREVEKERHRKAEYSVTEKETAALTMNIARAQSLFLLICSDRYALTVAAPFPHDLQGVARYVQIPYHSHRFHSLKNGLPG